MSDLMATTNTQQPGLMGRKLVYHPKKVKKESRGAVDPEVVIDVLSDNWDDFQKELGTLSDADKDALKEHLNSIISDSGDLLFGDADDFSSELKFHDAALLK